MGSTCSTLDGVDAPRSRASQIEQEQREKDAAALGRPRHRREVT